ncbi:MAG: DUF4252 domain-containing protein [Bacteroidales bacterium]|nr:DUF4252 domain-containing protein [Bacteroidales bacterium]
MKKIIFVTLCLLTTSFASIAANRNVDTRNIISTISDYKDVSGVQVVTVGKLGLGLAKVVGNLSAESEEDKAVLTILNGINKVVIVNYEDAAVAKQKELNSKLSELFNNAEKILEIKDEEDTVHIYGTSVKGGESIDDLMIFIPEDYTLICALGSISAEKIADLIKIANE